MGLKAHVARLSDIIADIPEAEMLSVLVDDDGPRIHLSWRFFQRWFGGLPVHIVDSHVSIVVDGATYTAVRYSEPTRGSIICPMEVVG